MKRFFYALAFLAGAFAPVARAQTLDSVKVDSVPFVTTNYDIVERSFYTKTVVDSFIVDAPLPSGTDTVAKGDTTFFTFWHTGRLTDSVKLRVAPPPVTLGVPYGPTGYFNETGSGIFTQDAGASSNKASYLLDNIAEARQRGIPFMPNLPCGGHSPPNYGYCLDSTTSAFSQRRFDAALAQFATPEVRAAVVQAHRDGLITGINIMDEPWVSGGDDGAGNVVGNTWGPKGTMTKARVDGLCAQVKALFPGVPVGTSDHLTAWEPTKDRLVCDFGQYQYSYRFGDVKVWRDAVLAQAKRGGSRATFSFNVINGGTQDRDGTWDCVGSQFGPKGQRTPNCGMSGAQIRAVGDALIGFGGPQMMWRHDVNRYARPDWDAAFKANLELSKTRQYVPLKVR